MEKRILKNKWLLAGRKPGFGIGFNFSRYSVDFDLGFWYILVEL